MRYLGHPVEIMARSFEAALAVDQEPNPIWIPPQDRPNAGLIWPTIAESRYHQQGWKQTLTAINMLWNSWYSPQKGPTS